MEAAALDLRALAEAAMADRWPKAARAHLARAMAPRWGISPASAEHRIGRWLNRQRDITSDDLAPLLDELGFGDRLRASEARGGLAREQG